MESFRWESFIFWNSKKFSSHCVEIFEQISKKSKNPPETFRFWSGDLHIMVSEKNAEFRGRAQFITIECPQRRCDLAPKRLFSKRNPKFFFGFHILPWMTELHRGFDLRLSLGGPLHTYTATHMVWTLPNGGGVDTSPPAWLRSDLCENTHGRFLASSLLATKLSNPLYLNKTSDGGFPGKPPIRCFA